MTTPLDMFLAIWAQRLPNLPYFETVNFRVDLIDMPPKWGSVIYNCQARPDVTMGSQPWVEEQGTFLIGLFTRSGQGPADLDAEVDMVRAAFHGAQFNAPDATLNILEVDGPLDLEPESIGEWWQVALTANALTQTRRASPVPFAWEGAPPGAAEAPPPTSRAWWPFR